MVPITFRLAPDASDHHQSTPHIHPHHLEMMVAWTTLIRLGGASSRDLSPVGDIGDCGDPALMFHVV